MLENKARVIKIQIFTIFKKWVIGLVGFSYSDSPWYRAYIYILLFYYTCMLTLGSYATFLVRHEIIYVLAGVHFVMGANFMVTMLNLKVITTSTVKKALDQIDEGIYVYEQNTFEEEYRKIQTEITEDLKWKTKIYVITYVCTFVLLMFGTPVLGYILVPEGSRFYSDTSVNNYIPHNFYTPFSTRTPMGFVAAYTMDVIFWCMATCTTYAVVSVMANGTVQLKLHLKVLNYSLKNIEPRAVHMFEKKSREQGRVPSRSDLMKQKEFQDCLNSCLRANIQHHQSLITYKALLQPFIGPTLLALYSVIVVVLYAALLFLILQPLPFSMKLKYICMLICEETAGYYISTLGEDVIDESSKLFESVYDISWFNYNKSFKKTLSIMMSNTMEPMRLKALFLDATASRESFGELIKATYTLMNLIRPST